MRPTSIARRQYQTSSSAYTANAHILKFLIRVLDGLDHIRGHAHAPTRAAQTRNRFRIFMRHVFALVEFYKLFARLDDLRAL